MDTDSIVSAVTRAYTPVPPMPGTHMQTSFTHLNGYSAFYYTYMWSLVIAKDLFSRFEGRDLMQPGIARKYRDVVFVPGSSRTASAVVTEFLGRPFNADAWEKWLNGGSK